LAPANSVQTLKGALPEWFYNYTDTFGDPAGDYLGAISQMDVQVGRLRQLLRQTGHANNTMLWHGAHFPTEIYTRGCH
jgi:arylsulfatase A-like enzyme